MNNLKIVIFLLVCFSVVLLGGMANQYVIIENNCRMPVQTEQRINTETHFSFVNLEDVNYSFLADTIKIKRFFISIGDILMVLGFIGILVFFFIPKNETTNS
jgi:hypothetical protein